MKLISIKTYKAALLALCPHSKKILGSNPTGSGIACSAYGWAGSLPVLRLPPTN